MNAVELRIILQTADGPFQVMQKDSYGGVSQLVPFAPTLEDAIRHAAMQLNRPVSIVVSVDP
jgi:hypothetical protein